jgi:KUP system potassium uptake protein
MACHEPWGTFVSLLSIIGISLLFGDSVITPAISILSAVEGLAFIPGLEGINQGTIVIIAAIIAIALFAIQKKGLKKFYGRLDPSWSYGFAR